MLPATPAHKPQVITILSRAFDYNRSVNHIARQGKGREARIRALMDYSFELCRRFGEVFLSEDGAACALILYPDRKRLSPASIWLDVQLIFRCIGLWRLRSALRREAWLGSIRPRVPMSYLWFIGTLPGRQGAGQGSRLLAEVVAYSHQQGRPVYLETSNAANVPWYKRRGFAVYATGGRDYPICFLRSYLI